MRIKGRLLATAQRIVGDDDADDALQEAFARLWSRGEELPGEQAVEAVAVTTVRNVCIDTLRRQSVRRYDNIDDTPSAQAVADDNSDEASERTELYRNVTALIDSRLSSRDRLILYRRDRDGWDFDEIAAETGLTESNVRVILSRARKTIRQIYRETHE